MVGIMLFDFWGEAIKGSEASTWFLQHILFLKIPSIYDHGHKERLYIGVQVDSLSWAKPSNHPNPGVRREWIRQPRNESQS